MCSVVNSSSSLTPAALNKIEPGPAPGPPRSLEQLQQAQARPKAGKVRSDPGPLEGGSRAWAQEPCHSRSHCSVMPSKRHDADVHVSKSITTLSTLGSVSDFTFKRIIKLFCALKKKLCSEFAAGSQGPMGWRRESCRWPGSVTPWASVMSRPRWPGEMQRAFGVRGQHLPRPHFGTSASLPRPQLWSGRPCPSGPLSRSQKPPPPACLDRPEATATPTPS